MALSRLSMLSMENKITAVEKIIHYTFNDRGILHEALRAAGSVCQARRPHRADGNKDLAQIGDTVLKLILVLDGYELNVGRGQINNVVSSEATNTNLAQVGSKAGLGPYIFTNPSQRGTVSHGVMASTVEAILGAVYLDSDMDTQAVRSVMALLGLGWPA